MCSFLLKIKSPVISGQPWRSLWLELFQDTIYQNIVYGDLKGTLDDVKNAMGMTGSDQWVDRLPQKWETVFDGENLSGGEIQKVMAARALMKKRSVIFMDEPTASLDRKAAQFLWSR